MIKIGIHLVNILFLTVAIYFAVDTGYTFLGAKLSRPLPPTNTVREKTPAREEAPKPSSFYQPIITRNLFHSKALEAQKEPEPKEIDIGALRKTQLQLKLWGTVATGQEDAYAVIESDKDRRQNLYRTGDTVSGASLRRILREKVILSVSGKDEILEMQKPGTPPAASPSGQRSALPGPFPAPGPPPEAGADSGGDGEGGGPKRRITLQRSQIESALGNIGQLMGEAKIEPNLTDGNPDGLIINDVKPNSLFRRMGLRNGDIITGVDGKTIESVDDALKLYENLKSADGASVNIKRKGQNQTIEYKIR